MLVVGDNIEFDVVEPDFRSCFSFTEDKDLGLPKCVEIDFGLPKCGDIFSPFSSVFSDLRISAMPRAARAALAMSMTASTPGEMEMLTLGVGEHEALWRIGLCALGEAGGDLGGELGEPDAVL